MLKKRITPVKNQIPTLRSNSRLLAVRAEQPKAESKAAFDSDIKLEGLINAIQVLPEFRDGVFTLLVWDGNQRRKALYDQGPTTLTEAVIWPEMTVAQAVDRGTAANHLLFAGEDDDIFSILDVIKDRKRIEAITGMSQKSITRYMDLHSSGLRSAIREEAFNPTYGLKLLAIAAGTDATKQQIVIDAVRHQLDWAKDQITIELNRAAESNEAANEDKTKLKKYFTNEVITRWRDELKSNKPLSTGFKKICDPVEVGDDEAWDEGVPKATIEGRKWKDFSVSQLDQLEQFAEKLIEEVGLQRAHRELSEQKRAKKVREQTRRGSPLGIHQPEESAPVIKQASPKATPIHLEGVGAAENPSAEVLNQDGDESNS